MKVYRITIFVCASITSLVLFFVITMGMGWIAVPDPTVQNVIYTIITGLLGSGTYATINSIIGYLNAKRGSILNFYYTVSDFFRVTSKYDPSLSDEEKDEIFDEVLEGKLFRKMKKAYDEIALITGDSSVKKEIDEIYAHCIAEEAAIRAVADKQNPLHTKFQKEKKREELINDFEEQYAENESLWKSLIDIYSEYA